MMISDERCEELIAICRQHEGRALTAEEARETLLRLRALIDGLRKWHARQIHSSAPAPLPIQPPPL